MDWSFVLCIFQGNRYFHGNDKQQNRKSVKREFCANQMWYEKANTNALKLWCMASGIYTRLKKFCMFDLE